MQRVVNFKITLKLRLQLKLLDFSKLASQLVLNFCLRKEKVNI